MKNKIYCNDCKNFKKNEVPFIIFSIMAIIIGIVGFLEELKSIIVFSIIILFVILFVYFCAARDCSKEIWSKKGYKDTPIEREEDEELLSYDKLNKNNDCRYYGAKQ